MRIDIIWKLCAVGIAWSEAYGASLGLTGGLNIGFSSGMLFTNNFKTHGNIDGSSSFASATSLTSIGGKEGSDYASSRLKSGEAVSTGMGLELGLGLGLGNGNVYSHNNGHGESKIFLPGASGSFEITHGADQLVSSAGSSVDGARAGAGAGASNIGSGCLEYDRSQSNGGHKVIQSISAGSGVSHNANKYSSTKFITTRAHGDIGSKVFENRFKTGSDGNLSASTLIKENVGSTLSTAKMNSGLHLDANIDMRHNSHICSKCSLSVQDSSSNIESSSTSTNMFGSSVSAETKASVNTNSVTNTAITIGLGADVSRSTGVSSDNSYISVENSKSNVGTELGSKDFMLSTDVSSASGTSSTILSSAVSGSSSIAQISSSIAEGFSDISSPDRLKGEYDSTGSLAGASAAVVVGAGSTDIFRHMGGLMRGVHSSGQVSTGNSGGSANSQVSAFSSSNSLYKGSNSGASVPGGIAFGIGLKKHITLGFGR